MKKFIPAIGFCLVIIISFFMLGCFEKKEESVPTEQPVVEKPAVEPTEKETPSVTEKSAGETPAPSEPLEYQLAVINKGGYVSEDDITVTRFRYLLESLDNKTMQDKQQIADMLVTGQTILREKYGKEYSLLALTEGVNKYIADGSNIDFAVKNTEYIQYLK